MAELALCLSLLQGKPSLGVEANCWGLRRGGLRALQSSGSSSVTRTVNVQILLDLLEQVGPKEEETAHCQRQSISFEGKIKYLPPSIPFFPCLWASHAF